MNIGSEKAYFGNYTLEKIYDLVGRNELADCGIATLRYDKRTFIYRQKVSSMDDETILDALSAIRLARKYGKRIFILGHSLGAMLAPIIASRAEEKPEGIIMMAAPARNLEEVVREQFDYLLPSGTSDSYKEGNKRHCRIYKEILIILYLYVREECDYQCEFP